MNRKEVSFIMGENKAKKEGKEYSGPAKEAANGLNTAFNQERIKNYGSAVKEHIVAYTGQDNGTEHIKGLEEIADSKVNPKYKDSNIKQQAGYSAEVKTRARDNAEKLKQGKNPSTTRTDDMTKQPDGKGNTVGGKNEQLYDLAEVDKNGAYIEGSGRQLKYVGGNADECTQRLLQKKFDKYRNADIPIEVPSDFYDDVKSNLDNRINSLKRQIQKAKENGNQTLAAKHQEQLERTEKTRNNLRKGKLTNEEAIEARTNPVRSTAKDIAKLSHEAGVEGAKYGAVIGGGISAIQNFVQVIQGKKDLDEAAGDVAKTAITSGGAGYVTTAGSTALSGFMQNSGTKFVRVLGKTGVPAAVVATAVSSLGAINDYFSGKITGTQCLEKIGENGVMTATSMAYATVGQVLIPISIVGGLIGGMVGYALTSCCYANLMGALRSAELAREERIRVEAECREAIRAIRAYREEINRIIQAYFKDYQDTFDEAFFDIKNALQIGDADGVISGVNRITRKLGGRPQFETTEEFRNFMKSDEAFEL